MLPDTWSSEADDVRPRPYMAALRGVVTTEGCGNAKCKFKIAVSGQACTLTSPEPVQTSVSSPDNGVPRLVPVWKAGPEASTKAHCML